MAQIALSLHNTQQHNDAWFNLQLDDFQNCKATTHTKKGEIEIVIWGDYANQSFDNTIIRNIQQNNYKSYDGRSWIVINKKERKVFGCTDLFGLFPIFTCNKNNHWLITSSREALKKSITETLTLNRTVLHQLIAYGQTFGNDSIFEDVKQLANNSLFDLNINANKLTIQQTPNTTYYHQSNTVSYKHAKEAIIESVRNSFTKEESSFVSLSAGLDSRVILSVCHLLKLKPKGICYGQLDSMDMKIAKQLATTANIELVAPSKNTTVIKSAIENISNAGCGEVPIHHGHALLNDSLLTKTKGHRIVTGTGAETYRAFYYTRGLPGFSLFGLKCLNRFTHPKIKRYIQEELCKVYDLVKPLTKHIDSQDSLNIEEQIQAHLKTSMSGSQMADDFYLNVRCQRMVVAGQQLLDSYYNRSHPFLRTEVVKCLFNLPTRYKINSHFHRKFICDIAPDLASIVWDKSGKPLKDGLPFLKLYPGISQRLNLTSHYGKAAKPMYSYDFKNSELKPLFHLFSLLNINQQHYEQITSELIQKGSFNHIMGFALVWSELNKNKLDA